MHASGLLKVVLKPRTITSSSPPGQSLTSKDAKSRSKRISAPETSLASLSVAKQRSSVPVPVKMTCLCAPTNHAGSFRCRLHRSAQNSWGGRPLGPPPPRATKPAPPAVEKRRTSAAAPAGNGTVKRVTFNLPANEQSPVNFAPVHRTSQARQSRLSRVSIADEVEAPVAEAQAPTVDVASNDGSEAIRHVKFTGGAGCASEAVLGGGMVFIKKLHTGKEHMLDVIGSGTRLTRAGLSL